MLMVILMAAGLIVIAVASFCFWLGREHLPLPPERRAPLSEIFPDLKEEDWKWLQSVGGYSEHPLYSIKDMLPIVVPKLKKRDQLTLIGYKEQTIAQQHETIRVLAENNKRMRDGLDNLKLGR